jgi:hypothetical protein
MTTLPALSSGEVKRMPEIVNEAYPLTLFPIIEPIQSATKYTEGNYLNK